MILKLKPRLDYMNDISITTATKNDIPIVLGLLYDLGRPKPQTDHDIEEFRKLITKYLKDANKTILVARYRDVEVVGLVSIMFLSRLNYNTKEMYIPELVVLEKYQNKGIGKKLVEYCVMLAKEKNCHRIRLESGNKRINAHSFYKNIGFEQSGLSFTKNLLI